MAIVYHRDGIVLWQLIETRQELLSQVLLTPDQQKEFAHRAEGTQQGLWLAARGLTQELFGSTIAYRESGAPYLVNQAAHISISHTSNILALGYNTQEIGIDIESAKRDAKRVAKKFTDHREIEIARELYTPNPELLVWCAKEALYKTHNTPGLEFKNEISIDSHNNAQLQCSIGSTKYQCQIIEHEEYLITKVFRRK
ncbi:MAG: 4'-phosphopantetheinyl transferase superfamily protein [Rikenellaceae bacterium]